MKANRLRLSSTLALSAVALVNAGITNAAVIDASLGVPQASIRLYTIDCPVGTHHLSANVTDKAPVAAPTITLKLMKGVTKSETTDSVDGLQFMGNPPLLGEFPSSTAHINLGAGTYYLLIEKSAAGIEQFRMFVECRDAFENPLAPVSGPVAAP